MLKSPVALWAVPAYLPYVQPDLTAAAIRAAQHQFGVALPASALALLAVQNGGYLRATWPGLPHECLNGIGPQFPSITRDAAWWRSPDGGDLEDEMWVPPQPQLLIPFDGGGHWDLCWDYRRTGPLAEPEVTYIDIEAEQDLPVAGSFDAFLEGLVDEVEIGAIRITADLGLDEFGRELAGATGIELEDQGDWGSGYRVLRARMGDAELMAEWMWVSPNRVPAGFHRDGQRIVVTPQTALRLPSEPDCRLIVTCTPGATEATAAALRATGL